MLLSHLILLLSKKWPTDELALWINRFSEPTSVTTDRKISKNQTSKRLVCWRVLLRELLITLLKWLRAILWNKHWFSHMHSKLNSHKIIGMISTEGLSLGYSDVDHNFCDWRWNDVSNKSGRMWTDVTEIVFL